ncbi:MAG: Gfo/Idh/MocA family oxidoreductase, partial [Acidobacteria bacterium]|nr:Gfo/Idh/MocA family oxidoreductase [Acidobacteriota bacterium]
MGQKRLGVGFIGAGFIAQFHIRSWVGVRDADIMGITSLSMEESEEAAALARKLNVGEARAYRTITDMVADPSIDAIWMCAPNYTRIENMEEVVRALEDGKGELIGVACEKPLGRNAAEARKMVELVKK